MLIRDCIVLVVISVSSTQAKQCFKHVQIFPLKSNCFIIASITILNKAACGGFPCFTPDSTLNCFVYSLSVLTLALVSVKVILHQTFLHAESKPVYSQQIHYAGICRIWCIFSTACLIYCDWHKECCTDVTYILLHRVQDQSLQLVQTVVDPRSPPLLHDRLVTLHKNKC